MDELIGQLVRFGYAVRREGVPVGPARIRVFCEAAAALPNNDFYWAGRASLVWRPEHIPLYDAAFRRFFHREDAKPGVAETEIVETAVAPRVRLSADADEETATGTSEGSASGTELLHDKSFAQCTEEDWAALMALVTRLPELLPLRRTRRYRRGGPGDLHVRRIMRRAASTGGEPIHLYERRRRLRVRPLVFLLDVSGSMRSYSRALLLFAHAVLRVAPDTEVFAFGTRLTRVTPALGGPSLELALRAGAGAVPDWDGGTRIGDALEALLNLHGRDASMRRAIAVICSDGLDTGEPALLGEQAARLHRAVHRVVWLNPLKEDPHYEPLARGMRAALPHVDVFASGHNVTSLTSVLGLASKRR